MKLHKALLLSLVLLSVAGCEFQKEADAKFGDQHFKTVIALVELHRIRNGAYPDGLEELKFMGDWDGIALNAVEYKKVAGGYELNLTRGWVGKPTLAYPAEFWQGLGIKKSNVRPGT